MERSESARRPISWAQEVPNSRFHLLKGTHSWMTPYWLSAETVLVHYRDPEDHTTWEHLNIRTGARRRAQGFGDATKRLLYRRADGRFEPIAASPDGHWLLGYRDPQGESGSYVAIRSDGREQIWDADSCQTVFAYWQPDSSGWFSTWKDDDQAGVLWSFRLGRRRPERLKFRGLPADVGVIGTLHTGEALFASRYRADAPPTNQTLIFAVALETGARARRLGVVPHSGVLIPSPDGRLLLARSVAATETETTRTESESLAVCPTASGRFRKVGSTPPHTSERGYYDGLASYGVSWHPDSRRVCFFYGDYSGYRLYLARA